MAPVLLPRDELDAIWPRTYEYEFERLPIEVLLGGPVADFFGD